MNSNPVSHRSIILLSQSDYVCDVFKTIVGSMDNASLHIKHNLDKASRKAKLVIIDTPSFLEVDLLANLKSLSSSNTPVCLTYGTSENIEEVVSDFPIVVGIITRVSQSNLVRKGLETILGGGFWLPRSILEDMVRRYRKRSAQAYVVECLTDREINILKLAGEGLTNAEIAGRLSLSIHTVKSHIHNSLSKLGASNRAQGSSMVLGLHQGGAS